jgi:hypothetical protein
MYPLGQSAGKLAVLAASDEYSPNANSEHSQAYTKLVEVE